MDSPLISALGIFRTFVLQIVAMKWKDKRRKKTIPVGTLVQNEDWRGISLPIWPITDDAIKWPAAVRLADRSVYSVQG